MAKTRFLFVYGTLMSAATGAMGRGPRARLDAASRVIGPASVAGHLFDLGSYPGLVLSLPEDPIRDASMRSTPEPEGAARVWGELRELHDPETVFPWLDRYEGIDPVHVARSDYRRVVLDVVRCDPPPGGPATVSAWVYVYQGPLASSVRLPLGRWPA